ncbi:hypothetical protein IAD21_05981 [Abditibacteriota bacterium]|nr:hypothetical protein IAD21_05981 [Abditibacteriota bacterium]
MKELSVFHRFLSNTDVVVAMERCPQCHYILDAFDSDCPRCHGRGLATKSPTPVTLPKARVVESTPETVGGTIRGGLLALLPAFFITLSFSLDWAMNSIHRDKHGFDLSFSSLVPVMFFVPLCVLEGVAVGSWVGSSLPVQATRQGAIVGAICSTGLCLLITFLSIIHFDAGLYGFIPTVFIGVVFCGAYGGAERLRNGHGDNDSQLFYLLGIGVLSACLPCIGLMLIMALGRNDSDKAPAALWGTIVGVGVVILMVLMSLITPK